MTNRENALIALRGGTPESVPCFYSACQIVIASPMQEAPPMGPRAGPGLDGYGVHQTPTESAGGMYTPTPGVSPVLTDVTKGREQVTFPDYEHVDWEKAAAFDKQIMNLNPELFVQDLYCANGLFERLHFLMGFEEAVIAIMEEPEAVFELVGAIADKKIEFIEKAAKYYQPDVFTFLDDYSHKDGLFMSPSTFREIFKPHLKRIADAVKSHGMIFKMHCCGKMDALAQDYVDIGIDAMDPVQPVNDFTMIKKAFGNKVGISGGLDVQNVVDREGATEEEIRAEVRRCIDTYAKDGGYMIYGASLNMYDPVSYAPGGVLNYVMDECGRYGHMYYNK